MSAPNPFDVLSEQPRPNAKYNRETVLVILERVAAGETLANVCSSDTRLPAAVTVRNWISVNRDGLAEVWRVACELQAHAWADELIAIADDSDGDIDRDKLRIGVRERLMRVRAPATYAPAKQVNALDGVDWMSVLRAAGCAPPIEARSVVVSVTDADPIGSEVGADGDGSPLADGGEPGFAVEPPVQGGGLSPCSPEISETSSS